MNITTEYLDADFWAFNSEKSNYASFFCQRARDRQTDLIITASDESFLYSFLPVEIRCLCRYRSCFSALSILIWSLIATHPNVCGFTANPDFDVILRQAQKIFPQRKEVVCVIDNSFLSNKAFEDFEEEWKIFQKTIRIIE